jgi:signal transduction histidine kinase
MEENRHRWKSSIQTGEPYYHGRLSGDRDRRGQGLTNLLTNAIKHSPRAQRIIVWLRRAANQAEMAAQDFGISIADTYHEHIFARFYQVAGPRLNTYPDLAIGLYIAPTFGEATL